METLKVKVYADIPEGFTGIAEYYYGTKQWYLDGKLHRTDGPAIEYLYDGKVWYLEDNFIFELDDIGEYILIEEGLPPRIQWLGKQVPTLKVLTGQFGIMYIPNLPGI